MGAAAAREHSGERVSGDRAGRPAAHGTVSRGDGICGDAVWRVDIGAGVAEASGQRGAAGRDVHRVYRTP